MSDTICYFEVDNKKVMVIFYRYNKEYIYTNTFIPLDSTAATTIDGFMIPRWSPLFSDDL